MLHEWSLLQPVPPEIRVPIIRLADIGLVPIPWKGNDAYTLAENRYAVALIKYSKLQIGRRAPAQPEDPLRRYRCYEVNCVRTDTKFHQREELQRHWYEEHDNNLTVRRVK